jgi:hypothetical protein
VAVGTENLFQQTHQTLLGLLLVLGVCLALAAWLVERGRQRNRRLIAAFAFAAIGAGLLEIGVLGYDVRPAELLLLLGGSVLSAVGAMTPVETGWRRIAVFVAPALVSGWLVLDGVIVPSITCTFHLVEHGEIHRQWALEYRALMALEGARSRKDLQSRYDAEVPAAASDVLAATEGQVELFEVAAPDGQTGWIASPVGCSRCRTFYLDPNDRIWFSRGRSQYHFDIQVYSDEIVRLGGVIMTGCQVHGTHLCR